MGLLAPFFQRVFRKSFKFATRVRNSVSDELPSEFVRFASRMIKRDTNYARQSSLRFPSATGQPTPSVITQGLNFNLVSSSRVKRAFLYIIYGQNSSSRGRRKRRCRLYHPDAILRRRREVVASRRPSPTCTTRNLAYGTGLTATRVSLV